MTTPKHWEIYPLSELVEILDTLRVPVNSSERSKRPGKVPYYGATGQVGTIDKAIFNEELLILGEDGVQFFDPNKPKAYKISGPAWVNNHAHVLRPKKDRVLLNFLLYFLNQFNFKGYANGTTRLKLTQGAMNSIPVPLPTIDEQHKIVEILVDQLSRLDAALVDVTQAKVKAAQFRRSLLQAGLNGFFNNDPRDEKTGLPRTWRLKTLADVANWTSGGTPSSKDSTLYGGDIPWIVIGDLTEGVVSDTEKKITQRGLDSSSAKKLPIGTVMVAMYGASIGRTGVMGAEMTTNQAIACGIPNGEEILGQYLLYFLQSQKNEFISAGKGGAQPNISQGVVKSWQIPLPSRDEQSQIINEIDSQLEHLSQASVMIDVLVNEAAALRRSLLQAAFTGQLAKEVGIV